MTGPNMHTDPQEDRMQKANMSPLNWSAKQTNKQRRVQRGHVAADEIQLEIGSEHRDLFKTNMTKNTTQVGHLDRNIELNHGSFKTLISVFVEQCNTWIG